MTWYWLVAIVWFSASAGALVGYIARTRQEARVAYAIWTPQNLPPFDPLLLCPDCGGSPETGHGFAGGDLGPYSFCPACLKMISKSESYDNHGEPPWVRRNPR
jgi:hypothetical protein